MYLPCDIKPIQSRKHVSLAGARYLFQRADVNEHWPLEPIQCCINDHTRKVNVTVYLNIYWFNNELHNGRCWIIKLVLSPIKFQIIMIQHICWPTQNHLTLRDLCHLLLLTKQLASMSHPFQLWIWSSISVVCFYNWASVTQMRICLVFWAVS